MLKNIPTPDSMEQVSLRLYFTAWEQIVQIIAEISEIENEEEKDKSEPPKYMYDGTPIQPSPWLADKQQFIARAQPDLQLAYTLIQQSQEIALKARICAVSPFLLLLGSDVRTWPKHDADFTLFRTLDASDLIKVVDTVCPQGISDKFSSLYHIVRSGRNKISHLGTYKDPLDPGMMLNILVDQYEELYKGRSWFRDRLTFQSKSRHHFLNSMLEPYFDDYEKTPILCELVTLFTVLTNKQYKVLFGFPKTVRRYICRACCYDAMRAKYGPSPKFITEVRTATLMKAKQAVFCHLCEKEYPIRRHHCLNNPCKSNVISDDKEWADHCHLCGEDQKDKGSS